MKEEKTLGIVRGDDNYREFLYRAYASYKRLNVDLSSPGAQEWANRYFTLHYAEWLPTDKDANIADLGCGDGTLLLWLKKLGFSNLAGVDKNEALIGVAKQRGVPNTILADAYQYLLNDYEKSYSAIFAQDVIEHLNRNEAIDLFAIVYQRLSFGGKFIVRTPNGESPFFGGYQYGDLTHETIYNRHSFRQLSDAVGFSKIHCIEAQDWLSPELKFTLMSVRLCLQYKLHRLLHKLIRSLLILV